ncbi:unnamed protein product [Paramecium sonneborni]|uniref:Tetratricopeptide repeat protein n=1 Tax=Paramecium sonneborni TaxID=65129 RepID=A0A8S1RRC0_9CILI|nr:unnamed protein product [Paramecium sonneborni]
MEPKLIQENDQINSGLQRNIKIIEINQENNEQKQGNIEEAEKLFKQGEALHNLQKYQEAIDCYDKAIQINSKYEIAWNNKGSALRKLQQYQEAIDCYDKAIQINQKYDIAWNNKGSALRKLQKYYEAIDCYDKAIQINSKYNIAWNNKGYSLHQLKKYKDAIVCYDQRLSICPDPVTLKLKADSLFELGNKREAKLCYITALEKGSNEKDFIKKQLSKL